MKTMTLFLVMDMMNDLVAEDGFNAQTYGVQVKQRDVLANTADGDRRGARRRACRIGYVRVGFSPDYREAPANSPIFSGRAQERHLPARHLGHRGPPGARAAGGRLRHRQAPGQPVLRHLARADPARQRASSGSSCAASRPTASSIPARARRMTATTRCVILEDCCAGVTPDEHMHAIACLGRYATIVNRATPSSSRAEACRKPVA